MQPDIKSLSFDVKAVTDGDPNGEFEAILSTPDVDREGESVKPGAFNPLPKSIPIHFDHDFLAGVAPIGVGEPYYDGETLHVRGRFAPTERAQEMRTLVNGGFITAMSAGFITTKRKGKDILAGDLIEGSLTATPMNARALVLASKALDADVKAGARNSKSDLSMLQAIHDHACTLGAMCSADTKSADDTDTKSPDVEDVETKTATTEDAAADSAAAAPEAAAAVDAAAPEADERDDLLIRQAAYRSLL